MLASIGSSPSSSDSTNKYKWAVFVDSETYAGVSETQIQTERADDPLPPRMRNTIAHELVHSFAFREAEFGLKLTRRPASNISQQEFVEAIERETEKLSPLLLVPAKYLHTIFPADKTEFSIPDIQSIQEKMAVSRQVLINRFNLLRLVDKQNLLERPSLRNCAVGIAEWQNEERALIKLWPFFSNFDRNIFPEFIVDVKKEKSVFLTGIFSNTSFFIDGEYNYVCEGLVRGGTTETPTAHEMKNHLSNRTISTKKRNRVLFYR